MKKTVDYIDLCRYDKELRYAVDVEVLSNDSCLVIKETSLDLLYQSMATIGF